MTEAEERPADGSTTGKGSLWWVFLLLAAVVVATVLLILYDRRIEQR